MFELKVKTKGSNNCEFCSTMPLMSPSQQDSVETSTKSWFVAL